MELSILLAKAWGLYLVILGLAFLIRKESWNVLLDSMKNKGAVMITGLVSLIIGIFMVLAHNIWVSDWRVVITIFGWAALIKGVCRVFYPECVLKMIKKIKDGTLMYFLLVVMLLIGIYLTYIGFTA